MNALTKIETPPLSGSALTISEVKNQVQLIQQVMKEIMKEGEHYGTVPGCGPKKALLKSGAEKLSVTFRLAPEYTITRSDLGNGHREYEVICRMIHIPSGSFVGQGVGSASTMESKHRWRTSGKGCPECGEDAVIKGRKDYGGGWVCFKPKGGCGEKFKDDDARITGPTGRVENLDIADVYNTVLKMAKKRAHVDATLTCTGASDIFEQDLDEYSQEELNQINEERKGGGKPKTEPPRAKAPAPEAPAPRTAPAKNEPPVTKKNLKQYLGETASLKPADLDQWYSDNEAEITANLPAGAIEHLRNRLGEMKGTPGTATCPDGRIVPSGHCKNGCKQREGCQSFDEAAA